MRGENERGDEDGDRFRGERVGLGERMRAGVRVNEERKRGNMGECV